MFRIKFWAFGLIFSLLAACRPESIAVAPSPQATISPSSEIQKILAEPGAFSGQQVTLEGTLEAEGQGLQVKFFLRDAAGARLPVSPWAPLEVMRAPSGKPAPHTMAFYVGQFLRLTGSIQTGEMDVFLQVATVEEP